MSAKIYNEKLDEVVDANDEILFTLSNFDSVEALKRLTIHFASTYLMFDVNEEVYESETNWGIKKNIHEHLDEFAEGLNKITQAIDKHYGVSTREAIVKSAIAIIDSTK